ncbi:hypothetical protein ACP70R_000304 [Stipagrostis hirtigluma subsp. patula]
MRLAALWPAAACTSVARPALYTSVAVNSKCARGQLAYAVGTAPCRSFLFIQRQRPHAASRCWNEDFSPAQGRKAPAENRPLSSLSRPLMAAGKPGGHALYARLHLCFDPDSCAPMLGRRGARRSIWIFFKRALSPRCFRLLFELLQWLSKEDDG